MIKLLADNLFVQLSVHSFSLNNAHKGDRVGGEGA